jgi:hypothetical protein
LPSGGQQNCPALKSVPWWVHHRGLLLLLDWPVATTVTIEQEERVKSGDADARA